MVISLSTLERNSRQRVKRKQIIDREHNTIDIDFTLAYIRWSFKSDTSKLKSDFDALNIRTLADGGMQGRHALPLTKP